MAISSVTELVQAIKKPRSLSLSSNRPFIRKSEASGGEKERGGEGGAPGGGRKLSENPPHYRRNSNGGTRTSMERIVEVPDKKQRKSGRRSFMGYDQNLTTLLIHILLYRCFTGYGKITKCHAYACMQAY